MDANKKAIIQNCDFHFICEKEWEKLTVIENSNDSRYCGACNKIVYLVKTQHDVEIARLFELCVAVSNETETDELNRHSATKSHMHAIKVRKLVGAIRAK